MLYRGLPRLDPHKAGYARDTDKRSLTDIDIDIDAGVVIFLGLSAAGLPKPELPVLLPC